MSALPKVGWGYRQPRELPIILLPSSMKQVEYVGTFSRLEGKRRVGVQPHPRARARGGGDGNTLNGNLTIEASGIGILFESHLV
jgi:hypothetical protein